MHKDRLIKRYIFFILNRDTISDVRGGFNKQFYIIWSRNLSLSALYNKVYSFTPITNDLRMINKRNLTWASHHLNQDLLYTSFFQEHFYVLHLFINCVVSTFSPLKLLKVVEPGETFNLWRKGQGHTLPIHPPKSCTPAGKL